MFVSLIILIDYPQSLTNAVIFGQGNLDLVREKSGKCQGILLSINCGNPASVFARARDDGRLLIYDTRDSIAGKCWPYQS